ncbi:hypothetical protein RND71_039594 [Anisodus tanguticus]|uniref:Uncharacterized protein n=1 Tax=Anisodus tanguticus TaxID=243964 RepID=A0AAE1UQT0_9SOLA|nr:hypothetical protein RND71_039594 [Anisodus tanguticus]
MGKHFAVPFHRHSQKQWMLLFLYVKLELIPNLLLRFSSSPIVIGDRSTYYFYDVCHMKKLSKPNGRDLSIPRKHLHQLLLGIKPALFGEKKLLEGESCFEEAKVEGPEEVVDVVMRERRICWKESLVEEVRLKAKGSCYTEKAEIVMRSRKLLEVATTT